MANEVATARSNPIFGQISMVVTTPEQWLLDVSASWWVEVPGQAGGLPVGMVTLIGGMAMICAFVQAILMLFRDGSVLILAACTPLAASGSFANATNGWKNKVLSWQLALIFYKPMAAIVYAVSIWLTGENKSTDPRVLLFGIAMMVVALVALPRSEER